ncbi:MAG: M15 family metallopeptidase [Candidatus Marinimicrobia bacterium]|jgi:zinc D-Ala-D-Ala dipeptidase|nr:M15 family metallopeptidase [Candidatus Neomarinimicrobiota bacterium]MBT4361548.1 M15 family metallopeptidase [Candidatus Neomarinimicrobiota bacterium]MBT4481035.1 M15 family metallopeptidase [Candidatus Neomarinimicrobiota bacterium]MBT4947900.1 M15 family metallopeptidase [Candidatus Neomarinimicrobiota bacterium]MBT5271235.1 M15 family metallopeptidase [Candidatus Neomarinimicrobiota bacterium]
MKNRIAYIFLLILICLLPLLAGQELSLEEQLQEQGLVNIHTLAPDILVELKYSTSDNFLGADTYGELENCYLQPKAAAMLKQAQDLLKKLHPELTLLVYDGARPRSIQRKMWALVVNTPSQDYVANPDRGSVHNFGSAVDLTIATTDGVPLDMGTAFDYFGKLAQPRHEARFLTEKKLTQEHIENRHLLRDVMTQVGFQSISIEWWHFNAVPVKVARSQYRIIE